MLHETVPMTNRFADGSEVWSAAGGGPGRQGLWDGRVLIESTPVWCLAVKGAVQASVVFDAAGRSLVADMAGWVHAFSVEGRLLWGRQIEGAVSATPAVDTTRDRVFAGTHLGWVYAMRASDGAVLWRQRLPTRSDARIGSDLLLTPGAAEVVSSSWGGRFCALDAGTGQTRRTWDAGLSPQAGASADRRGNLYSMRAVRGEGVVCVRLDRDGRETVLCRQPEGKRGASRMVVAAAPVVDEDRGVVFFCVNGDRETTLHAWSLRDERVLWTRQMPRFTVATPALRPDGAVVVAGMDGAVRAFAVGGAPLFSYATGADYLLAGPVCDAAGTAFVGDPLGRLHAVDQNGAGRAVFEAPRSIQARPAFDWNGHLHVACTDRTVRVFRNRLVRV